MNIRFEIGNVAGSRPAFSRPRAVSAPTAGKSAMLDPPEPIQPSARRRGAPDRVGMADAHPDRQMRLLHRLRRHRAAFELIELAAISRPAAASTTPGSARPPRGTAVPGRSRGTSNCAIVMLAAEPDAEDRPPAAEIIERRPLMRDHQRAVDRQHHHRRAEPDRGGDRRGIGQHRRPDRSRRRGRACSRSPTDRGTPAPRRAAPPRRTAAMSIGSGERCGSDMPSAILSFKAMLGRQELRLRG